MAFKYALAIIVAIVLPSAALATEWVVGDASGWTPNFDYESWAKDKVFHVGDTLLFKYQPPEHNVFKVNGTGYQQCIIPSANEALTSGHDVITLNTPGNKWYICGVAQHCAQFNQKLKITVLNKVNVIEAPSPAPTGTKIEALSPAPTGTKTSSSEAIVPGVAKILMAASAALALAFV